MCIVLLIVTPCLLTFNYSKEWTKVKSAELHWDATLPVGTKLVFLVEENDTEAEQWSDPVSLSVRMRVPWQAMPSLAALRSAAHAPLVWPSGTHPFFDG